MTEKEQLLDSLVSKSGKSKEEIEKLIHEKVNELSGLVSEEGAMYIVANELDIKLDSDKPKKEADLVKIEDILEPKMPVSLISKVLRKYDRVTFSSKNGGEGSVQSILVGDETGIIRVVFWNDKTDLLESVSEGDILKILNGYSRENLNNQRLEIHYGPYSDLEINPEGVDVEVKPFSGDIEYQEKKISELKEDDRNVKIIATIADVDVPRFYLGCENCFKKVFSEEDVSQCPEHGQVNAIKIPIINLIVDDGSGSISLVAFRDRAEQISDLSSDEIVSLLENVDKFKNFSKKLLGARIEAGGNSSTNSMTGEVQFLANQILSVKFSEGNLESSNETNEEPGDSPNLDDEIDIEEIDLDDDLI